jgi:putative sterol carrier protein
MIDPTVEFFEALSRRGSEPMLSNVTAEIRFDITRDRQMNSWRLAVNRGQLTVFPEVDATLAGDDADCVITAEKKHFDGIVGGGVNAMAALLRGEIAVTGDPELVVAVQRLFPARRPPVTSPKLPPADDGRALSRQGGEPT